MQPQAKKQTALTPEYSYGPWIPKKMPEDGSVTTWRGFRDSESSKKQNKTKNLSYKKADGIWMQSVKTEHQPILVAPLGTEPVKTHCKVQAVAHAAPLLLDSRKKKKKEHCII